MNLSSRHALSVVFVAALASAVGTGCAPASEAELGDEQLDAQHSAFTSASKTVGDWSALPSGVECLVGMQVFYPAKFGVRVPIAPESYAGDCAPEGACHLWLDAQPDLGTWEQISSGTPSTYDLIVYPPIGNDPWGHVASVDHVENGQIYVMDDNYVGHHVRSSVPHTVDWPAYGWYHLRSLPKTGDGGGDTGGSNGPSCAGLNSGLYCGGDHVGGDANTLYRCSGGSISIEQKCDGGCQEMPDGQNDQCAAAPPSDADDGSCAGHYDGLYCGGDYVNGDASTLYRCSGGKRSVEQKCGKGCQWMPDGDNDACY